MVDDRVATEQIVDVFDQRVNVVPLSYLDHISNAQIRRLSRRPPACQFTRPRYSVSLDIWQELPALVTMNVLCIL